MDFYTAAGNVPFSIALGIVLLMGGLEVLSLLLGGASSLIGVDGPDLPHDLPAGAIEAGHLEAGHGDIAHTDGDADIDVDAGPFGQVMSWLHVGQMPATVIAMLFLLAFGVSGLAMQNTLAARFSMLLPASVAVWPAGIVAILTTRVCGGLLKPVLPREETQAVSSESFVGCAARINIGTARPGKPAEARVVDKFGHTHYVMVEPEHDEEFKTDSAVLIIKRREHIYRVIDNTGGEV